MSVGMARANGFGVTLDKVVGDYTANVDYDAVAGIFAGEPVQFAFQLFNKNRSELIDFTDVWVTVAPTGTGTGYMPPIFEGGITGLNSGFVPSGMMFVFQNGGSYDLKLRFDKDNKTLAEVTFPLTVVGAGEKTVVVERNKLWSYFFFGAVSAFALVICGWFFKGAKRNGG